MKNGRVKLKIVRKSSLNLTLGQGTCLISEFTRSNSKNAVLVQDFMRFEIVIMISTFCSMAGIADWFFAREILKRINMFYPV